MKRQRRGGRAGAPEKTVTKAIRPVKMLHVQIRIPDTRMLIKYILSPLAIALVVHRATMVSTVRESDSAPIVGIRKLRASKTLLFTF